MKERKIVIIRGLTTAGKSTISYELAKVLPGWIFIDIWKIKEMFEPLGLKDRKLTNEISKESLMVIIKRVVEEMGINLIIQESSVSSLRRNLGPTLYKNNYKIYSFFLDLDDKDVVLRDLKREKPTMNLKKQIKNGEFRKKSPLAEEEDYIINTSKNNVKKTINLILKELGERKKKHPFLKSLRKTW